MELGAVLRVRRQLAGLAVCWGFSEPFSRLGVRCRRGNPVEPLVGAVNIRGVLCDHPRVGPTRCTFLGFRRADHGGIEPIDNYLP